MRLHWLACMFLLGCGSESSKDADSLLVKPDASGDAAAEGPCPDCDNDASLGRYAAIAESVAQELAALKSPGAAVAIMEGGKLTFAQGFGRKSADESDPVLPTTLFRYGSSNKMMTAAALLQLVQSGEVSLTSPVTQYVPDIALGGAPGAASSIQVRHLLEQTSGMHDFGTTDWPDRSDEVLSAFLTGPAFSEEVYLMSEPGEMWNYSNPNYMIAGLVTERVSGSWYREYMRDNVFAPLGMTRTFYLGAEVLADGDYAVGKTVHWADDSGEPAAAGPDSYDNAWARPAGYGWSSVLDLSKFAGFLMSGNDAVLEDPLRKAMATAQTSTEERGDLDAYGYGLFVHHGIGIGSNYYAIDVVEHGGDIAGFATDMLMVPSKGFAFLALSNADGAHLGQTMVSAITSLLELPAPSPWPDVDNDPSLYPVFAGEYLDPIELGTLTVSTDGKDLFVSIPALDSGPVSYDPKLVCVTSHACVFVLRTPNREVPMLATFLVRDGKVEYVRTRFMVARRTQGASPDQAPKLDADALVRKLHESPSPLADATLLGRIQQERNRERDVAAGTIR